MESRLTFSPSKRGSEASGQRNASGKPQDLKIGSSAKARTGPRDRRRKYQRRTHDVCNLQDLDAELNKVGHELISGVHGVAGRTYREDPGEAEGNH